ncbi:MAG: glycosyltransferase family 2 protein [Planctomycetia bacterium]|nr:glycosyltransferase family 2 protein [Planctomycetia bacterium]
MGIGMKEQRISKYQVRSMLSDTKVGEHKGIAGKTITLVVPAYNEEANIAAFYEYVRPVLESLAYSWELIFIDDGSQDGTLSQLESLAERDHRVKYVSFSRNFGNQMAITAGLESAKGDAVIVMDADLQQPAEMIGVLVEQWERGFHVVNTIRNYGREIGYIKRSTSALFYQVMNMLSDVRIQQGVSDFRLMDRRVVNILNNMPEHSRFIRAQIAWLGFRQTTIPYQCNERHAGVPSFSTRKLIALALDGIFSFSVKPLRWIALLGLVLIASLLPYGLWAIFQYFVWGPVTPGWTSLFMVNLFLGGAVLISLGIIGEYIGRIYDEVKHRPRYIVGRSGNLDTTDALCESSLLAAASESEASIAAEPDDSEMTLSSVRCESHLSMQRRA